ncbi:MAG: NAD(P)/FAD-dependent oxidoreductase [Thermoleophilia bacterium]|nr:NAD(P)/FAD-dependent oxidoreductase [Thermoleophilia bacterium]MDH4344702.1 NAD(P)/FAD-dependent oxidoreductase [Thermoleophilia bacterium]MDH5332508.1 NAD(P)/FAD-dependent oxidoreductase [Thermoleophilia bacterium]
MTTREARGGTLVIGGGYAGSIVARKLGRLGATIVSPDNFVLYTPLLPEAASGMLEPRHVVVPLRQMCPHAELLLGRAVSLDERERAVVAETLGGTYAVRYQRLVIALGAIARSLPVPGLSEHGRGFKDVADAIALRNHVLRTLEAAAATLDPAEAERQLGYVFVGAGYAGVEALAELGDLVHDAVRRDFPELRERPQRWVLVDAAERILHEVPQRLGRYAAQELQGRGVEIHVGTTLTSYDGRAAALSDGTVVPARTLVWTAGVRANPVVAELGLPLDERGRVVVDEMLRVRGREDIWALGDCAAVPNTATPGRVDPPTCQHALRQARQLAQNLHGPQRPYGYRMLGQVATLGRYKGIADVLGLRLRGFPGWFVARTYHLYALPLLPRRIRVVTDWTVALLFRRDVSELSAVGHPRRLEP